MLCNCRLAASLLPTQQRVRRPSARPRAGGDERRVDFEPSEESARELIRSPLIGRGVQAFDASAELEADVARLRAAASARPPSASPASEPGLGEKVNNALVSLFFLVLFFGAWLLAGLAETSVLKTELLSTSWLKIWPVVIQPALGVRARAAAARAEGRGGAARVRWRAFGGAAENTHLHDLCATCAVLTLMHRC